MPIPALPASRQTTEPPIWPDGCREDEQPSNPNHRPDVPAHPPGYDCPVARWEVDRRTMHHVPEKQKHPGRSQRIHRRSIPSWRTHSQRNILLPGFQGIQQCPVIPRSEQSHLFQLLPGGFPTGDRPDRREVTVITQTSGSPSMNGDSRIVIGPITARSQAGSFRYPGRFPFSSSGLHGTFLCSINLVIRARTRSDAWDVSKQCWSSSRKSSVEVSSSFRS